MKGKRVPKARTQDQPLTPTDEEILKTISVYRYMTALDVAHCLFSPKSLTHVRSLLSALSGGRDYQERDFLYRFPFPTAKAGNRERVFTLGAAGREVIEGLGIPVDWYYRPSKTGRLSHSHLAHQLTLTRFVVCACQWTSKHPEYTLADVRLSYALERSLAMPAAKAASVIPDAWLLFERVVDRARFPVLLEVDRGSEYQERFKNHVRARLEFIRGGDYERVFGTPAVIICYVTTGQIESYRETRVKTMAAWTWQVLAELKMERWAGIFRFTSVVFETLYEDAQSLFETSVWHCPDSPTPVPLLTAERIGQKESPYSSGDGCKTSEYL